MSRLHQKFLFIRIQKLLYKVQIKEAKVLDKLNKQMWRKNRWMYRKQDFHYDKKDTLLCCDLYSNHSWGQYFEQKDKLCTRKHRFNHKVTCFAIERLGQAPETTFLIIVITQSKNDPFRCKRESVLHGIVRLNIVRRR